MSTPVLSNLNKHNIVMAKDDSAATSHYWREEDKDFLTNVQDYKGPSVILPGADSLEPSNQGILPLSNKLSKQAKTPTTLPKLKSSSLISLGQLCDDDCVILLNKKKLYAIKEKVIVLEGNRNYIDGLWYIPIQKKIFTPR